MHLMIPLVMFGWIPAALYIFAKYPPRRAMIVAMLAGWLFLPVTSYSFHGFPDYDKYTALAWGLLVGVFLFDGGRLMRARPRWFDLPMIVFCLVPLPSAIRAGTGVYAGLSAVMYQSLMWGVPYMLGRIYCSDYEGVRDLAIGIFAGGIVYVPLCLFEMRMSPTLSYRVYGFEPSQWLTTYRLGGWRPIVFLEHGLALGMWMGMASLIGFWLWRTGALKKLWSMPMSWLAPLLVVVAVLCRSTGAIALLAVGIMVLVSARRLRTPWPVVALALSASIYMVGRTTDVLSVQRITSVVGMVAPSQRVASMKTRLDEETVLTAHAMKRPIFGWGPWGGFRTNRRGQDIIKFTDGLWVIMFGKYGLVGLAAISLVLLLPMLLVARAVPLREWATPEAAALVAVGMVPLLYMYDCLMNAMPDPVFLAAAGAAAGAAQWRNAIGKVQLPIRYAASEAIQ